MLNATVQKLGDTTILRCQGRIVVGDAYTILRKAVLSETRSRMLVLDLAQVDRVDASGLGVLLGLREWARSNAIRLQLMNVMNQVEQILELTKLDRVFEFCSVRDIFHMLRPAAYSSSNIAPRPLSGIVRTNLPEDEPIAASILRPLRRAVCLRGDQP